MQLEIQYFFPLTEQISLDLDFRPCQEFEVEKRKQWVTSQFLTAGTGLTLLGSNDVSWSTRLGDWEIQKQDKKPNKLQQWMMKRFFGMKWMGK